MLIFWGLVLIFKVKQPRFYANQTKNLGLGLEFGLQRFGIKIEISLWESLVKSTQR